MKIEIPAIVKYNEIKIGNVFINVRMPGMLLIKPSTFILNKISKNTKQEIESTGAGPITIIDFSISLNDGSWVGFQAEELYIIVSESLETEAKKFNEEKF